MLSKYAKGEPLAWDDEIGRAIEARLFSLLTKANSAIQEALRNAEAISKNCDPTRLEKFEELGRKADDIDFENALKELDV